jgi:DNA-binding response OmpR family regulator
LAFAVGAICFSGGVHLKILLVHHDAELAALTGKSLERKGYDVTCCSDISETASLIERQNIRLVIADFEADETERLQFCKTVKSTSNPPKLLFIAGSGEEESSMLNAGADDWMKKPYKTPVFLARISALLRQSGDDLKREKEEVC